MSKPGKAAEKNEERRKEVEKSDRAIAELNDLTYLKERRRKNTDLDNLIREINEAEDKSNQQDERKRSFEYANVS